MVELSSIPVSEVALVLRVSDGTQVPGCLQMPLVNSVLADGRINVGGRQRAPLEVVSIVNPSGLEWVLSLLWQLSVDFSLRSRRSVLRRAGRHR